MTLEFSTYLLLYYDVYIKLEFENTICNQDIVDEIFSAVPGIANFQPGLLNVHEKSGLAKSY
jgi:hypothetical protein